MSDIIFKCLHSLRLFKGQTGNTGQGSGSRVRPRQREPVLPSGNPLLERFPEPIRYPVRKRHPFLKFLGLLLVVGLVAVGVLYFLDLGEVTESAIWDNAIQTLKILKKTGDPKKLNDLKNIVKAVKNTEGNRYARCGLLTVFALGQLVSGNERDGLAACRYIEDNYGDTKFAGMVRMTMLSIECPSCSGKGGSKCSTCNGTGKCPSCGGAGKKSVKSEASRGLGSGLKGPTRRSGSSRKIRRIGEGVSGIKRLGTSSSGKCYICKGTGKCTKCDGSGYVSKRCSKCGGSGQVLSKSKIVCQYDQALEKALFHTFVRQKKEKLLQILIGIQSMVRSLISRGPTPEQADDEETSMKQERKNYPLLDKPL